MVQVGEMFRDKSRGRVVWDVRTSTGRTVPALRIVGRTGGAGPVLGIIGLGSAHQGDLCVRWEVPGTWPSEGGGWGVDFFVS